MFIERGDTRKLYLGAGETHSTNGAIFTAGTLEDKRRRSHLLTHRNAAAVRGGQGTETAQVPATGLDEDAVHNTTESYSATRGDDIAAFATTRMDPEIFCQVREVGQKKLRTT